MEQQQEQKEKTPNKGGREAGMMITAGSQGVGKTYQNMHTIANYVKDKLKTKVRGRKCLIFDTNGEYTQAEFAKNSIENFTVNRIAVKDVEDWGKSSIVECRRIDAKNLSIDEKIETVQFLLKVYRNGMLVLEDINTYILALTHMKEIVGGLVNLRHRAVDVIISFQSLRPVEPRLWQNSRWIRMHYQADNVNDIKGKINNIALLKISQLIVNHRYLNGDKRFFVFIHNLANKVEGRFTLEEFKEACKKYINTNKRALKEYQNMNALKSDEAVAGLIEQYVMEYYGNK
jgi:hypothetical protein